MDWLDIDFVKCDKTENKSLVVELEPHLSPSVLQEPYDVKLPYYPNLNEIIFSKNIDVNAPMFYFRKQCFIKTLYLDLRTLFSVNTISFDLPSNEDIMMHYQTNVVLVSPIAHKEFRVGFVPWITASHFQSYITIIWHLYHNNDSILNDIITNHYDSLSRHVVEIAKLQSEILSNFSEGEIKAMNMEESPLYLPIVMEGIQHYFNTFVKLIHFTNNKEVLNRLLTDERSAHELSGEAKAIIIKRMAELEDERSFEL